jgi:hypothetical protein
LTNNNQPLQRAFDSVAEAKLLLRSTRAAALATLDHDGFGLNQSKTMSETSDMSDVSVNVIDSKVLERDPGGKPVPTFPHPALAAPSGFPFASLVNVATAADGSPLLLLSRLAAHTRHLDADSRLSLLFYSALNTPSGGDPLTQARLTLVGRAERVSEAERAAVRTRFLARHPKSSLYADFADFGFFRVTLDTAHLNGGFGRAANLSAEQILTPLEGAAELIADEMKLITELESEKAGLANALAAARGSAGDQWRLAGFDPEGLDIADEEKLLRLPFAARVTNAKELRAAIAALAGGAGAG